MILKNDNPTEIEKQMYLEYGLYPVDRYPVEINGEKTERISIRYAVCNIGENEFKNNYPNLISIDIKDIDYNNYVFFETSSEKISLSGNKDLYLLTLIIQRAKELGYGRYINVERKKVC